MPIKTHSPSDRPDAAHPGRSVCQRCGSAFRCGIAAGEPECWCFRLPPLRSVEEGARCLCPECLRRALGEPATE